MTVYFFKGEGRRERAAARSLLPSPVTTKGVVIPRTPHGGRGISLLEVSVK